MTHVLLAPDKFKGTLTAAEVAQHVVAGLLAVRPDLTITAVPVADGGDGTLAAALAAGYEAVEVTVSGPTGAAVPSAYARRGTEAVVELADASGLGRLPGGRLAPMSATSRGTGELVAAALDAGCRQVVLGIGGSACTDGGAGMLQGLGARVTDADGEALPPGGAALADAAGVDLSGLHPALAETRLVLASDVDNPLLGSRGAAAVYGPQKGADPGQVAQLDAALARWASLVAQVTGEDRSDTPGAGAAGGVGFAAIAVLGATMRPGIDVVLELTSFHEALDRADLVITGEGSVDQQTLHGKAPAGVAALARAAGVPVVAVAGQCLLPPEALNTAGFAAAYALTDQATDVRECFERPGPLLERIGRLIAEQQLAQGARERRRGPGHRPDPDQTADRIASTPPEERVTPGQDDERVGR